MSRGPRSRGHGEGLDPGIEHEDHRDAHGQAFASNPRRRVLSGGLASAAPGRWDQGPCPWRIALASACPEPAHGLAPHATETHPDLIPKVAGGASRRHINLMPGQGSYARAMPIISSHNLLV